MFGIFSRVLMCPNLGTVGNNSSTLRPAPPPQPLAAGGQLLNIPIYHHIYLPEHIMQTFNFELFSSLDSLRHTSLELLSFRQAIDYSINGLCSQFCIFCIFRSQFYTKLLMCLHILGAW